MALSRTTDKTAIPAQASISLVWDSVKKCWLINGDMRTSSGRPFHARQEAWTDVPIDPTALVQVLSVIREHLHSRIF